MTIAAEDVTRCLSLAAAPTFAAMAAATGLLGGDPAAILCSGAGASPMSGMTLMYALMAVFHLPPWARLLAREIHDISPPSPDRP
ncbi:MAG: hypothetical protein ACOZAM_09010 [Pseudomonadota bacterium]